MKVWTSVTDELPKPYAPILMKGSSGYREPHDTFYVAGYYRDDAIHPSQKWVDCCGDAIADNGWYATEWLYISEVEERLHVAP
jgi:hypothetical protein